MVQNTYVDALEAVSVGFFDSAEIICKLSPSFGLARRILWDDVSELPFSGMSH